MNHISNLIDQGDYCPLIAVIAILYFIGFKMVHSQPVLHKWGVRTAAAVFLLFAITKFVEPESLTARNLLWAVVHALFAAGLVLGPTWILLAIAAFLHRSISDGHKRARRRADELKAERDKRKREDDRRQQALDERLTPEREQALREAQARHQAEEEEKTRVTQRREDARVACELLYNLHAPDLKERFPKEAFEDFVSKYMGDEQPPELVEQRAGQLQSTIQQHYQQVNPPENLTDLGQLACWYEKQKKTIERLNVHRSYKDDYLVQPNQRYAELTQNVLEKLEP